MNLTSEILYLGAGTGLIVNKIYKHVRKIVAVEAFEAFTKFIVQSPKIEIVNQHLLRYEPKQHFDLITAFGLMHYFDENEAIKIYKKYFEYIKPQCLMIIKNQFGIQDDVVVSGYSEEQKSNYYAQYRHIDKEVQILKNIGFKNIEIVDIYPPECNRWDNTHFYAIVAQKIE